MALPTPALTVDDSLAWFAETFEDTLAETERLCRIPAPTFDEAERAAYVEQRMREIGLDEVHVDEIYNVTGTLSGDTDGLTFTGEGGHSWGAFGIPSAIHAMGTVIHHMSRLNLPRVPKTTYNVGLVEGGESVNTMAPKATMVIDLRSIDLAALERLENQIARILNRISKDTGIEMTRCIVGQRPAAALDAHHPLRQEVASVRQRLHLRPATFSASSTDANLPLSQGIPSLCLGITRGGLAHTVREYIDIAPILPGLRQLYLMILHTLEPQTRVMNDGCQSIIMG